LSNNEKKFLHIWYQTINKSGNNSLISDEFTTKSLAKLSENDYKILSQISGGIDFSGKNYA